MAVGPCGVEFRDAFSCFHYSEADPKGADCIEKFQAMQDCMKQYPELYDDKKEADLEKATEESEAISSNKEQTDDKPTETPKSEEPDVAESEASPAASEDPNVAAEDQKEDPKAEAVA